MQRYIEQLIEDLQNAKKNVLPEPDFGNSYKEFEAKMFAIETAPSVPTKQIYGVSFEELPPPEKLTIEQMQQLINAISDTWEAFSIGTMCPDGVPVELQYEVMRDSFANDVHYMPGFSSDFDFCIYWCEGCKIAQYCEIKDDIMNDDSDMENRTYDEDELPF